MAFEMCWHGLDYSWLKHRGPSSGSPDKIAVHCMYRLFPRGCRSIIWSSYPRVALPLLCLYCGLLIVWQDWQAPWQSWLKALRSEKWDRYRANTCLLAVSQSPTGCVLHWRRINGSIKTQRFFSDSATLACKEPFTWLFLFSLLFAFSHIWKGKCCSL